MTDASDPAASADEPDPFADDPCGGWCLGDCPGCCACGRRGCSGCPSGDLMDSR